MVIISYHTYIIYHHHMLTWYSDFIQGTVRLHKRIEYDVICMYILWYGVVPIASCTTAQLTSLNLGDDCCSCRGQCENSLQSTPARKPARRSEPNGSVWEPRCFQQNEVSTTVYAALVRYFCYFWPACIVQCADTQYDMCSVQVTNLTSRALRTLLSLTRQLN